MVTKNLEWKIKDILNLLIESLIGSGGDYNFIENLNPKILQNKIFYEDKSNLKAKPLFQYSDPLIKRMVWLLKYEANQKVASIFSDYFYEMLLEDLSESLNFNGSKKFYLVTIPLSQKRWSQKGFNPIDILALEIYRKNPDIFELGKNFLIKTRETKPQRETISRKERLANLKGAFESREKLEGKSIILIDDVLTTGATIKEAEKTLYQAGATTVLSYTIAH